MKGKRRDKNLRKSNGNINGDHMVSEVSLEEDDHSTTSNSIQGAKRGRRVQQAYPKLFGAKETRQICWLKGVTLISFLVITAVVSTVMFYSTTKEEEKNFEDIFEEISRKIGETFLSNLQRSVVALDNFAVTLSANGEFNWPFVLVNDFEIRAASTRLLAKASVVALIPIVIESDRVGWHTFASSFVNGWVQAGLAEQERNINYVELDYRQNERNDRRDLQGSSATSVPVDYSPDGIATSIFRWEGQEAVIDVGREDYFPMWQSTPVQKQLVNFNLLSHHVFGNEARLAADNAEIVLGNIMLVASNSSSANEAVVDPFETTRRSDGEPVSQILVPVAQTLKSGNGDPSIAALLQASIHWTEILEGGELPSSATGIVCVVANDCDQAFYYRLEVGEERIKFSFADEEDSLASILRDYEYTYDVGSLFDEDQVTFGGFRINKDYCPYRLHIYPTQAVQDAYYTRKPILYTSLFVIVFVFTSMVFLVYDCLVERRQKLVMTTAIKSHEIVSNLFPENVRGRLFGEPGVKEPTASDGMGREGIADMMDSRGRVRDGSTPIADLFPATTVLFADIAGFTAWSSVRDPAQVFILLETIYAAFDKIATKRKVFKVETIGDCYVAVTGLPTPQPDHAVIMVKFARECLRKMTTLTRGLEVELGPDTGDLCLRIGVHSGPVTAGVLRGQKSRFQLFGDTVNTASRMESNGRPTLIQCSSQTADILKEANRGHWIIPRKEMVHAKGKGLVQTYWVVDTAASKAEGGSASRLSETESDHSDNYDDEDDGAEEEKNEAIATPPPKRAWSDLPPHMQRLIHWNVDMLGKLLKNVVAARMGMEANDDRRQSRIMNLSINLGLMSRVSDQSTSLSAGSRDSGTPNGMLVMNNPREEYSEAISLPRFDPKILTHDVDPNDITLDEVVARQLEDYVTTVACAYHENPFHNFEHASHVTMSANKILKRVVAADDLTVRKASLDMYASKLHDFTYGITSDPLTHFACVFSAMIHDVDHPGVPNMQLVKEKDEMAEMYENKSVAEQNSFDFSWELLMDPSYEELRKCIFSNDEELKRFRQLVVNSIMATDVFDPELVKLRNSRWEKAFAEDDLDEENPVDKTDLKATIVIEHIIQAADVAHTMQHWHVYQKWNRRLFEEMYSAYKSGRGKDPSEGWYKGELWFFDNYIIPLAKKLKDCGVFGPSSDEFLTYAMDNRSEWQAKGESIVEDMLASSTNKSEELSLLGD